MALSGPKHPDPPIPLEKHLLNSFMVSQPAVQAAAVAGVPPEEAAH
jgi:hypothetical protein